MNSDIRRIALQMTVVGMVFGLALFGSAGTLYWPAGWIFLGMFLGYAGLLFRWLYRNNPGLLRERMHLGTADQHASDKLLFPVLNLVLLAWLAFDALDARRFHWSSVPFDLQLAGGGILLVSFYLLFLTFRANSYLSPVVRFQADRSQSVVTTGPYRYVRHPMYSAILLLVVGTSLLLGSAYGLLWAAACMILLVQRARMEERLLVKELPEYATYKAQVRQRLIPYVW
jgi:protein-S-isoprenylcysteine O-methyltransferase Ste14